MTLPVFPALRPPDMAGVQNGQLPGHMLVKVDMAGADARCHPEFARALRALIHDCKAATGADLTTIGHYRSLERQIELLKERYVRASSGSRFWDGSWWRKVSGATVATPGTSDHGWGLAIDGAVWDARSGEAIGIAGSAAWPFIRAHLTDYGLCWAWQDEDEEPWHWHLFQIGAPAVVAFEGGDPGVAGDGDAFDPANRRYGNFPLIPNKEMLQPGSTGDAVRYLQGVCRHEVARFALWFWALEPETLPDGQVNPRKLYLRAAADECARLAVDGRYDEAAARAVAFVQSAFSQTTFDGRPVGELEPDGRVGRQQTWPFIDSLADGVWAA